MAMLACKEGGKLGRSYEFVQVVRLQDRLRRPVSLLVCSCDENRVAKSRLMNLRRQSRPIDDIQEFEQAQRDAECIHGALARKLFPQVSIRYTCNLFFVFTCVRTSF